MKHPGALKFPEPVHQPPRPKRHEANDNGRASHADDTVTEDDIVEELSDADLQWADKSGVVERPTPPSQRKKIEELDAEPIASAEDIYDLEKTKEEIEATEVDGFKHARAFLGMRSKFDVDSPVCEDYVVAVPEHDVIGVGDGIGQSRTLGAEVNGLNPAAQASRALSGTIADRFGEISGKMNETEARRRLEGAKILDVDPNVRKQQEVYLRLESEKAKSKIDELLKKNPKAALKAAALIESFAEAQKAVKKTKGMTTACVAAREGDTLIIASVGDSMGFIQRPGGEVIQATREDSLLNFLLDNGALTPERIRELAEEPEKKFPVDLSALGGKTTPMSYRYLSAATMGGLGSDDPEHTVPTLSILKIEPGTRVILATDGISDKIRGENGEVSPERLTAYLGRDEKRSPTDQIETAIAVSEKTETKNKSVVDDMTIAIYDVE